ncbi:nucleotide kinase domain-containing protein, partial [Prevotella koreensis]
RIGTLLSLRRNSYPVFNNAYMMTGSDRKYDYLRFKHEKWLAMVQKEFIGDGIIYKILDASSMEEIFHLLEGCTFIGGFLAYQYAIDFNYTPYINFSENSFVKAGIGAIRGIKKCFVSYGRDYEDAIYFVQEHLDDLRRKYGFTEFRPLSGHEPTLIDLQNCFCETDKYLRAEMPELQVNNVRIKQKYKMSHEPILYEFPEKWQINNRLNGLCSQRNTKELTLF